MRPTGRTRKGIAMSVEVFNETEFALDLTEFSALAEHVFAELNVGSAVEMNVLFVDPDVMETLHEQWLGLPGTTDVLSFPMDELRPGTPNNPVRSGVLGDVVICPQVAQRQARDAGHSSEEEMLLLEVHGILHLLGFDHAEPEEEAMMFSMQRRLLLTYLAKA